MRVITIDSDEKWTLSKSATTTRISYELQSQPDTPYVLRATERSLIVVVDALMAGEKYLGVAVTEFILAIQGL